MKIESSDNLGVQVSELPIQKVSADDAKKLVSLVHEHKMVILKDQEFDETEYVAFSRVLGVPQVYPQANYHHPQWPEIFVSTNIPGPNGEKWGVKGTGRYWHTDCAFLPDPLPFTMVTPRVIPKSSRGTLYIDMQSVYDALPKRLRAFVDTHNAIHEGKWRYKVQPSDTDRAIIDILDELEKIAPPVPHPAVIVHPVTKKRILYISSGFTTGFEGVSYEEGKRWLAELVEFVEREEHVHQKTWRGGEILLWDNRVLIHKAAHGDPNEPNRSYRIGVYDGLPFYVNATHPSRAGTPEERHAVHAGN
ncbi:TauD/TfdA dioxygenase family protein [Pendulispora albinea]|uniref:TauD/TfdA family dioxygenase n=1 Tax=Pendulispora albinea TaxID=2741071 RepID=A0ABZ2M9M8_9BACT